MKTNNARTTIWVMAVVLSLASSSVLGVVDFNDGGIHDIDYEINDDVWVDWQTPLMYTTVNMLAGGNIMWPHELRSYEDSRVNILGGSIEVNLHAFDSSRVDMSGGSIGGVLLAHGSSQVSFSGGSIGYHVATYYSSQLDISSGSIGGYLSAQFSSQVDMSGGSIGEYLQAWNNSQVSFSGGSIGKWLTASHSSQVDMSGGSIGNFLGAEGSGHVDLFGGSIGGELFSGMSAILTIHGSDFAVDGVPFGYGELTSILGGNNYDEPSRHLTGTLASGEPIDNDFYIGEDGKIVLIPAPGAVVLGSIGVGLVNWLRRRRTL